MKNMIQSAKKLLLSIWKFIIAILYKYRYLWRRIGIAIFTLFLSTFLIFILIRLVPGNVVDDFAIKLVEQRRITYEEARILAVQILGYDPDASPFTQFFSYLQSLMKGNLGQSMANPLLSVNDVIRKNLPWTLFVSTLALSLSYLIGTRMGSFTAWVKKGFRKKAIDGYTIVGSSIPDFILGLLFLFIFSFKLKIFPGQGAYDSSFSTPGFNIKFMLDILYHATLPVLAYMFIQTANWTLMMKGSSISVLGSDYIMAANARGIPEKIILKKYLRRNAILPLITSLAISFAALFGGSPLMESVFNYPGIGQQFSIFIVQKEYFMIIGVLFFTSAIIIFVNLIADSIYSLIDPRIRRNQG